MVSTALHVFLNQFNALTGSTFFPRCVSGLKSLWNGGFRLGLQLLEHGVKGLSIEQAGFFPVLAQEVRESRRNKASRVFMFISYHFSGFVSMLQGYVQLVFLSI